MFLKTLNLEKILNAFTEIKKLFVINTKKAKVGCLLLEFIKLPRKGFPEEIRQKLQLQA